MKNNFLILCVLITGLLLASCSKEEQIFKQSEKKEAAFDMLKEQLNSLESNYSIKNQPVQKEFSSNLFEELLYRLDENGLLEVSPRFPFYQENWNCQAVDNQAGVEWDLDRSGLQKRISRSVWEQAASDAYAKVITGDTSATCGKYMVTNDGFNIYNPYKIDPLYPVNYAYITLGAHPAYQVGIEHNLGLQAVYTDNPGFINQTELPDIIDKIVEANIRLGFVEPGVDKLEFQYALEEAIPELFLPISVEKYENLAVKYPGRSDEIQIFGIYMTRVSQLSGAIAVQYTRDFAQVVEFTSIPEDSKYMILGFLSTAINSRVLWNMQLPNPMETNQFILYNEEGNTWDLVTTERLIRLMMSGEAYLWGIPKFNKEKQLTAVIFYKNYWDYIPFREDVFNSLLVDREFYTVNEPITISNDITINNSRISDPIQIETGEYPIYTMEEFEGIYIIAFQY